MVYSEGFKSQMVRRMTGPGAVTATVLAAQSDVPQPTLSRWLREAGTVAGMKKHPSAKAKQNGKSKRPSDWSPEERLRAIEEASHLSDDELGAFLRRKGLHEAQLTQWRTAFLEGVRGPTAQERKQAQQEAHRVKKLERELKRKEKALAEAAALLVLEKKLHTFYGAEDDDT